MSEFDLNYIVPCTVCGTNPATEAHHLFSQTKPAIKHYGKKLIDSDWNKIPVCQHCHTGHAEMAGYIKDERWFRSEARSRGIELPEPMKSYKGD